MAVMSTTNTTHPSDAELGADLVEAGGDGLRVVEIGLTIFAGLLICPPLLILAVVVAVPFIAIAAIVAAVVGAVALPVTLVRRVRAHHREHGTTLFLHRLLP
jgi:hypothetical protein